MQAKSVLIMGDVVDPVTEEPIAVSPRNILKNNIQALRDEGFEVKGATELEYYLYSKKYSENFNQGLANRQLFGSHSEDYLIQQGDRYEFLFEQFRVKLKESGIPVECTKGEASIGQHELNISHAETLSMSDTACALKLVR